MDGEVKNIIF